MLSSGPMFNEPGDHGEGGVMGGNEDETSGSKDDCYGQCFALITWGADGRRELALVPRLPHMVLPPQWCPTCDLSDCIASFPGECEGS